MKERKGKKKMEERRKIRRKMAGKGIMKERNVRYLSGKLNRMREKVKENENILMERGNNKWTGK